MRTISEIAGELYAIIDREYESHFLWDRAYGEAKRRDGLSPFTPEQVYEMTQKAVGIHGEVVDRLNGIIKELTNTQYVDRNSPPELQREAEKRLAAQQRLREKRRARVDAETERKRAEWTKEHGKEQNAAP
jgi:hypothetical protein